MNDGKLQRKLIYQGSVIDFGLEQARLPNGELLELEIVRHPGGACVAALNEQRQLCLIRQFRHATGGWIQELPAGKIDANESPLVTAKRELLEEAGLIAKDWISLGSIYSTPGFCDEQLFLFLARNLETTAARPESTEFIEIGWYDFDEVKDMAADSRIEDAKSIATIYRVAQLLQY